MFDEVVIAAPRRPGAADVERHGPMAFVVVRFALRPRLQHGDRPMADEIVEAVQDAGDGRGLVVGRDALGQHGLEDADQEERRKQVAVVEMSQQVGVVRAVGRQHASPARARTASAWRTSRKAAAAGVQLAQPGRQRVEQRLPRARPRRCSARKA